VQYPKGIAPFNAVEAEKEMKERTLSKMTLAAFCIGVISYLIALHSPLDEEIRGVASYVFAAMFGLVPLLLMVRAVSSLFLQGMEGASVESLELAYTFIYFALTKEARKKWRDQIQKLKTDA